jgi:hypothetical protein
MTEGPSNKQSTRDTYAWGHDIHIDRPQQLGMLSRLQQQLAGARASPQSQSGLIDRLSDGVGHLQRLLSRTGV